MTYTEKELNQFLHGISQSLLSKKSAQHWRYDEETAKEIEWLEALERKVRADKADRKTENSSEIPNNCKYAESPSGDVWECGCFLDTYCEHQIYDRNPDGTINIVECGYEPKTEPQTCEECEHWNDTEDGCADRHGCKTEPNSSEKPNNCEHITEDGVTCAKYPACDDCPDNPLNKVKGSERLVKGSEQTDCQTCKWWSSYGYCVHRECKGYEPQTERSE